VVNRFNRLFEISADTFNQIIIFLNFTGKHTTCRFCFNNGNMLTDLNNNIAFILYDTRNLPLKVYTTNKMVINYVYDIEGNRINNIMNNSGYRYIYGANGQTELREKIVNGSVTQVIHNIFGNDLLGTCTVTSTSSEKNYFLKDHLGSIKVIVDEDGSLSSYTDYDPFGLQLENRYTVNNEERYKFTGKERDEKTSYDYFGARYYDSSIGRWLQVDPLAEKYAGWSTYNYTMNNPLIFCDLKGKGVDSAGTARLKEANEELEKNKKEFSETSGFLGKLWSGAKVVFSGLKVAYEEATIVAVPGPATIETVGSELSTEGMNASQLKNLERFEKNLPNGAGSTIVRELPDGGKAFQSIVPARNIPGSYAVYEKQVDAKGVTLEFTKTTVAPDATIIHVKDKIRNITIEGKK